jgi:uncharacterized membrane protein
MEAVMPKRNRSFVKRVALGFLVLVTILVPLCGFSEFSDSKQVMEKLGIEAQLKDNGDMQVTETWRVNLKDRGKPYRNLYKTFPVKSGTEIENLSVYDVDYKTQYEYRDDINPTVDSVPENVGYLYTEGTASEIGWFMPAIESGVRNFKISYTIRNIVRVYKDTSELYIGFVGKNFSLPITELQGQITIPTGAAKEDLMVWLHSTANGTITRDSGNQITFSASQIPAKTLVEPRVLMPVSLFPSSKNRGNTDMKAAILKEEQDQANAYVQDKNREYLVGIVDAAAGLILVVLAVALFLWHKNKTKRHSVEAPEYTREIPEASSPGGAANLFYYYKGGVADKERGRVFSATLMSLAYKGYVRFDSDEHNNLLVTVIENTAKKSLTSSEQNFYNMIVTVAEDSNGKFTMKEFKRYAENHSQYIDRSIDDFLAETKREIAQKEYYERRSSISTACSVLGTIGIVFSILLLFLTKGWLLYFPLGLLVFGILMTIAGNRKNRLSEKGEYDYAVWHGLEKYMLEFSRMKEYGVPQLVLWEEYLVYATMMGISEKVCEQLRLVYPQLSDEGYMNTNIGTSYMYYMFGRSMGMGGFHQMGNDFGSALGETMNNISTSATRLAHPPSSNDVGGSGFGGGSFGGGGGGFGSGGGGGVR